MKKSVLITCATKGIGPETTKAISPAGQWKSEQFFETIENISPQKS